MSRLIAVVLAPLLLAAADPHAIVRHAPMTDADRALLVEMPALARAAAAPPPKGPGVWTKGWSANGRLEIDFAYEPASPAEGPTVANSVNLEVDVPAAKRFYADMSSTLRLSLEANGIAVRPCAAPAWGDEARCELYVAGEHTVGQSVFARRGRKVFLLSIFGASIPDAALQRMLAPKLKALEAYEPDAAATKPARPARKQAR